jgi:proteasome accessory factor B
VGHDLDRDAPRCFRLSRIVTDVTLVGLPGAFQPPANLDLISYVARWSGPIEKTGRAIVRVRPGRAAGVRRWAAEPITSDADGDVVVLAYAEPEGLAAWLVGYGADVTVLAPDEVRKAVVDRLRDLVEASSDSLAGSR